MPCRRLPQAIHTIAYGACRLTIACRSQLSSQPCVSATTLHRLGLEFNHHAIVDSGSSFMYLPSGPYNAIVNHWLHSCPWGNCSTWQLQHRVVDKRLLSDDYCYRMSRDELVQFDPLTLHFSNGALLPFGPLDYTFELYLGVRCLSVLEDTSTVLGGAARPRVSLVALAAPAPPL